MPHEPHEFLNTAKAQDVYLLGCNHRQVTFYSQQTRAINLVHSLVAEGQLQAGDSVAVVGGGVAGLTAAAFAAEKGCTVDIYEKENDILSIQAGCRTRWVHPHIYDWPEAGSLNDDTGDLPVLNWTAGAAARVIDQIRQEWHALQQHCHDKIRVYAPAEVTENRVAHHDGSEELLTATHKVVIVAVGFGLESERFGTRSYWEDQPLPVNPGNHWLVSGFGDGALADLLRVCINNFEHAEIKDFVSPVAPDSKYAQELLEWESRCQGKDKHGELNTFYEGLQNHAVMDLLRPRIDLNRRIIVQGKPGSLLYGPTSAIINRFIVSQIYQLYREEYGDQTREYFDVIHELWQGEPLRTEGDLQKVEFARRGTFNGSIIVRHGPKSTLETYYSKYAEATASVRQTLLDLPQQLDPTRLPIVSSGPSGFTQLYMQGKRPWQCLILTKDRALQRLMGLTLPKLRDQIAAWYESQGIAADDFLIARSTKPYMISAEAALSSQYTYQAAVRFLCSADVVIADVTGFNDPAIMLLLGIRSAVRRGITLVSTKKRPALEDYNQVIPFNLKELRLLEHSNASDRKAKEFKSVIARGMTAVTSPQYQDLPVYSEVRTPDSDWPKNEAIFLCSFTNYEKNFDFLASELTFLSGQTLKCSRVIDDASPRLATHRLYEAIRHASACVVDWTHWRANVFFEMGVRLAVHPQGAICLCAKEDAHSLEGSKQLLYEHFKPSIYQVSDETQAGDEPGVREAWIRYQQPDDQAMSTYDVVSQAIEPDEPFFTPIHQRLLSSVQEVISGEPGEADVKQLYAEKQPSLSFMYTEAAREQLLAAWYYMENRYQLAERPATELHSAEYAALARDYVALADELVEYLGASEFAALKAEVINKSQKVENLMKER